MTTAKHQLEIFKMIVLLCVCVSIKHVHQIYDTYSVGINIQFNQNIKEICNEVLQVI